MLFATTLLALQSASAQQPAAAYEPDPYGWPVEYVDESYPDGTIGGYGGPAPEGVVGGEQVPQGRWDDAVGVVFYGAYVGCTGTLVAPNVVITAGHCVGGITDVLIGSKDWSKNQGEIIEVGQAVEYPDSWYTYDIAVLKLVDRSTYPHRNIALDCIIDDYLEDGAEVAVVGYGSTNEQGTDFNTLLNEGYTFIQDADCDEQVIDGVYSGCNTGVSPGGELGAGGNGVDACFGDSGGPLYLLTPEGDFLVGVTSRAYLGVNPSYPCREGGIYVRPDAVIDWIEEAAGRKIPAYNCNEAPEVFADAIEVKTGESGFTYVDVEDDGADFTVEVVEEPEHGTVDIDGDEIEFVADEDYEGEDSFVIAVTDDGNDEYARSKPITVELDVPVTVVKKKGLNGVVDGCGCSATGSPTAAGWLLGLVGLLGLRRRRR